MADERCGTAHLSFANRSSGHRTGGAEADPGSAAGSTWCSCVGCEAQYLTLATGSSLRSVADACYARAVTGQGRLALWCRLVAFVVCLGGCERPPLGAILSGAAGSAGSVAAG